MSLTKSDRRGEQYRHATGYFVLMWDAKTSEHAVQACGDCGVTQGVCSMLRAFEDES